MTDEPDVPISANELAELFRILQNARYKWHRKNRSERRTRRALNAEARGTVFAKTGGRCHICGGLLDPKRWKADHVRSHSSGGPHCPENYLPAHRLCNGYRWDYSPEEFQWILKIGVWARTRMRRSESHLDSEMLNAFFNYEVRRQKRRRVFSP